MDQSLQIGKVIDQKIGRCVFESLGGVPVGYATRFDRGIAPGEHVDGGVPDHPRSFTMSFCVGQDLENTDGVGFLVVKAIPTVYGGEMLVDTEAIQHRA